MIKFVLKFLFGLSIHTHVAHTQDITWTWVAGTQGANFEQTDTDPGGRSGAAYWQQDDKQAVWLFGGEYHKEGSQPQLKNDLWQFSQATNTWILIHGGTAESPNQIPGPRQLAAACGLQGVYFLMFGGLGPEEKVLGDTWIYYMPDKQWFRLEDFQVKVGVKNSSEAGSSSPRGDMAVWCTNNEMLIFGGFDEDNNLHHDLWRFSLSTLSWRESEQSSKLPKNHDFVKHLRYPAGRSGTTTWVAGERLFMFGGNILPDNARSKHLVMGNSGDLWEYKQKEDSWVYFGGRTSVCTTAGEYSVLGIASPTVYPSCRRRAAAWVDYHNNLWMFGGDGFDNAQTSISVFEHSKLLSDLWYYDLESFMWTWKGGNKNGEMGGQFGDKGKSARDYLPGSRCESVMFSVWNYFYLFGGVGHDSNKKDGYLNDVWKLDVSMDSSVKRNSPNAGPVFGMIVFGLGLVILVSILFCLSRKYFQTKEVSRKGIYKRIPLESEQ